LREFRGLLARFPSPVLLATGGAGNRKIKSNETFSCQPIRLLLVNLMRLRNASRGGIPVPRRRSQPSCGEAGIPWKVAS
jgi:hypothetical protein